MLTASSKKNVPLILIFRGELFKKGTCFRNWKKQIDSICHTKKTLLSKNTVSNIVVFFECFSHSFDDKKKRDRFLNQIDSIFGDFEIHFRFVPKNLFNQEKTCSIKETIMWVKSAAKPEYIFFLMVPNEQVFYKISDPPKKMERGSIYLSENSLEGGWKTIC